MDGYTPDDAHHCKTLKGSKEIKKHLIFGINMYRKFTCKAMFMSGGHMSDTPSSLTYSTVITYDLVHIVLLILKLNELEVENVDIINTYLNIPTREKDWIVVGSEFGSNRSNVKGVYTRYV